MILLGTTTGDTATGNLHKTPRSSYEKGPEFEKLTADNAPNFEGSLFNPADLIANAQQKRKTWLLLTRYEDGGDGTDRVHFELSQPAPTSANEPITDWAKRCCFTPYEDEPTTEPGPPATGPINVDVSRR